MGGAMNVLESGWPVGRSGSTIASNRVAL